MSDEALADIIRRAQAKDADAFDDLVDGYGRRLFGFFVRTTGSRDEAEDLLQEAFLRVVRTIADYRHTDQFDAWLFRIATNLVRDAMRRRQRRPAAVSFDEGTMGDKPVTIGWQDAGAGSGGDAAERHESMERVQVALLALPEAERDVVLLRHFSQLTFAQIAEMMGTPLGTALARAHRGLAKLRKLME